MRQELVSLKENACMQQDTTGTRQPSSTNKVDSPGSKITSKTAVYAVIAYHSLHVQSCFVLALTLVFSFLQTQCMLFNRRRQHQSNVLVHGWTIDRALLFDTDVKII